MPITIIGNIEINLNEVIDIKSIKDNIVDMVVDQIDYDIYKEIIEHSPNSYQELIKDCMLYIAQYLIEEYEG